MKRITAIVLAAVLVVTATALPGKAYAQTVGMSDYDTYSTYRFTAPYTGLMEFTVKNSNMYQACVVLRDADDVSVGAADIDCPDGKCTTYWYCAKGEVYTLGVYARLYNKQSVDQTSFSMKKHVHSYELCSTNSKTHAVSYICTECQRTLNGIVSAKPSYTTCTYSGKVKKPDVKAVNSAGIPIPRSCYNVTYSSGRKNVGSYTVTVTFTGEYKGLGTIKTGFTIKPKKTYITSISGNGRSFSVKWRKQTEQTSGYQVMYSSVSTFKTAGVVKLSTNKVTALTVKGLKANHKYYVKVRTYKVCGKTKVYSDWSKVKEVKTGK